MNKINKCVICIVSLCLLTIGDVSPQAQTQPQINEDFCNKLSKNDQELNAIYNQVLAVYRDDLEFIESIKKAQRAWIVFRDYHVDSIYPKSKRGEYGSVKPMCRCEVLSELTIERAKMLRKWLVGVEEGDVCSGSIKFKSDLRHSNPR